MLKLFQNQPRAFGMIFLLELWERFGFYSVQGVLTLFFIKHLGYSEIDSYYTFGAFSALVYSLVVLGGYLGDHILGVKRTIVLGLITLSAGYFALAMAQGTTVFLALGLICVGNGLFKANPSNLLAKCYEPNDQRLHAGFTLYYMAINVGSMIALFIGPIIATNYGYAYTYFMSGIGLILGLINYCLQRQTVANINSIADRRKITRIQWCLLFLGLGLLSVFSAYLLQHIVLTQNLLWGMIVCILGYYLYLAQRETKQHRAQMIVALILMLEAIIFFTLYQQMPTSLNLFAVNNITPQILGMGINPQSLQSLNGVWIVVLSPFLAIFYTALERKKINFSIPYKFAAGMLICALGFLILFCSRYAHDEIGNVSAWWLVLSYFFQSLGELLVSALGVAMVAELVPATITGFVMGMWFLTTAISGFTGATVSAYTALPQHIKPGLESLMIYTNVFGWIGLVTLIIAVFMGLCAPILQAYIQEKKVLLMPETQTSFSEGTAL